LFFGGFETEPWTSDWGIDWGPEPAGNNSLIQGREALEGHSLRVKYSQGAFSGGGCQFLTDFSKISIPPQESLYLRYYVRFDPGFDFVKGGKLPGLAGGQGNTGGHKPNGRDGWSARIMWRSDGKIVQYVYHPDQPGDYGEDFPWDFGGCPRFFRAGQWQCVETFVKMNTPGKKDGMIVSWLDGDKALEVTGLRFRDIPDIRIDKLEFETFFGGGDASWASPRDQYSVFDNVVLAKDYIGPDPALGAKLFENSRESVKSVTTPTHGVAAIYGFPDPHSWTVSTWSDGTYDLDGPLPNGMGMHLRAGGKGHNVLVKFPNGKWGGVQFDGRPVKAKKYQAVQLEVFPTGCDVEFRIRFELNHRQVGIEKAVTAARIWDVNQWNQVEVPLSDFQIPEQFDRVVITSNSPKAVSPFYVDEIGLEK